MHLFESARDHLYSTLFPQQCLSCNEQLSTASNGNACDDCWAKTEIFTEAESLCVTCGKPSAASSATRFKCLQCDGHFYDRARSIGIYSYGLRASVIGLKTNPNLARRHTELLLEAFRRSDFLDSTLIVPVPLSKQRAMERGFNQAEVIANSLGRMVDIRIDASSLIRNRHSPIHRVGMDQKARDLSVRDSFEVVRPKLISGQKVLLADDVLTTGATVSYCAKALKKSGATQVNVLTLARAV